MGTAELGAVTGIDDPLRFYSLPRDGDSGTKRALASIRGGLEFLFAVARWGQRNAYMVMGDDGIVRFYSLSRDGDSGTRRRTRLDVVARVSIRCREMGTAERRVKWPA